MRVEPSLGGGGGGNVSAPNTPLPMPPNTLGGQRQQVPQPGSRVAGMRAFQDGGAGRSVALSLEQQVTCVHPC